MTTKYHFNPPAPCGAGHPHHKNCKQKIEFQSTRPMRGGTILIKSSVISAIFQSTRPMRGGTMGSLLKDLGLVVFQSTRPMRGGTKRISIFNSKFIFQSTRPMRGGTGADEKQNDLPKDFNPPAPCGAGQQSCTKFTPCILAQYTIQRTAKLLFAYQQAYFC